MKSLVDQTLYEILEVAPEAPAADIAAAYERVRSLYAPGSLATYALMSSEEADLLTRRIEEAKATLLDAGARARYDEALARGEPGEPVQFDVQVDVPPPAALPAASPVPAGDAAGGQGDRPALAERRQPAERERPDARLGSAGAAHRPILLEREVPAEVSPPGPAVTPAPRAPAPPVPEVSEWTGEALRLAREARGITVRQVAERTKVTRHHIENIEGDRFGSLPAPVYLRGILLAIARELRLDGQRVARSYLERAAGSLPAPPPMKQR